MFPIILVQIELFYLHFWKPAREISRIYNVMFNEQMFYHDVAKSGPIKHILGNPGVLYHPRWRRRADEKVPLGFQRADDKIPLDFRGLMIQKAI